MGAKLQKKSLKNIELNHKKILNLRFTSLAA